MEEEEKKSIVRKYKPIKKDKIFRYIWSKIEACFLVVMENIKSALMSYIKANDNVLDLTKLPPNLRNYNPSEYQKDISMPATNFTSTSIVKDSLTELIKINSSLQSSMIYKQMLNTVNFCCYCGSPTEKFAECNNHHKFCLDCAAQTTIESSKGYYLGTPENWTARCGDKFCKGFWVNPKQIENYIFEQVAGSQADPTHYMNVKIYNNEPYWANAVFFTDKCVYCNGGKDIITHDGNSDPGAHPVDKITHSICNRCLKEYWESINPKCPYSFQSFDIHMMPHEITNCCPFPFCKAKFTIEQLYAMPDMKLNEVVIEFVKINPMICTSSLEIIL
jgi:hypothetical protein